MAIRIANIFLPEPDGDLAKHIRAIAERTVFDSTSMETAEAIVSRTEHTLSKRFPKHRFDLSFHTYANHEVPIETGARNSTLLDISIDDKYTWMHSQDPTCNSPDLNEVQSALSRYQGISKGYTGATSWETGFYRSVDDAKLVLFEAEIFPKLADQYLDVLIETARPSKRTDVTIDVAFLLGFATHRESESIEALFSLLTSSDHAIHNMAARSLFPKAVAGRCEFLTRAGFLIEHQCSYCLNKYLGTVSIMKWTDQDRGQIEAIAGRLKLLANNGQPAVFLPANAILNRLSQP